MKKLAVALMIAIACLQATGGFAVSETLAKRALLRQLLSKRASQRNRRSNPSF